MMKAKELVILILIVPLLMLNLVFVRIKKYLIKLLFSI
ncbi:hypothetical protein RPMD05_50 [Rhodobacteraceae phage LS06-2018-MD05]|nr:hypothetical protein RPMD05_50 [Rhodobacteraceae phage LS06-2018-MD05]